MVFVLDFNNLFSLLQKIKQQNAEKQKRVRKATHASNFFPQAVLHN